MSEETKVKKAYKEILDVLKKHREFCVYDIEQLESLASRHLFGIELKEKYGLNVEPRNIYSLDWNNFGDFMAVGQFGEKYHRTISWSDDGEQPEDELLLRISFPTGAYIFGDDYPEKLFQELSLELKSYGPKYTDSANKNLYFSMGNAGKVFNAFEGILKKYYELNKRDAKRRAIEKLKSELEKLEAKS